MKDASEITILILDDEESIRESLVDYLEDAGYNLISAGTAQDAIEQIAQISVDVAIVDIRLSGKDGNYFIIEASKISSQTKFIIHTGSVNYQINDSVRNAGVSPEYFIQKPVSDLSVVISKIESLFNSANND